MNDLERITREHARLWSARDADAVAALYADDCAYEDAATGAVMRGQGELKGHAAAMFSSLPDGNVELTAVIVSGNHSAREYVYTGTHAQTGKKVSVRGVSIAEFRGEKIVRNTDYYDVASFQRQLR